MPLRSSGIVMLLLAAMTLWVMTATARAQSCSFTMSNVAFGNIDVTLNTTFTATGTFTYSCTGTSGNTIRVCPNFDTGTGDTTSGVPRRMASGTTLIDYNLYQDSGHATVWGDVNWAFTPQPPTIDVPLPGGSGSGSRTVYALVNAAQTTLPALTYTSNFNGGHTSIAYDYTSRGNCQRINNRNRVRVPFTVTAVNVKTCRVTANNLNFGSVSALSANLDVNGSASVTCTNTTPYRVLLNNGLTGTGPTARRMTLGGNHINYGLYRDAARTLPWGNISGTNSLAGTGTGSAQTITIYGRVPSQSLPPAGTYSDTIVMTVEY